MLPSVQNYLGLFRLGSPGKDVTDKVVRALLDEPGPVKAGSAEAEDDPIIGFRPT